MAFSQCADYYYYYYLLSSFFVCTFWVVAGNGGMILPICMHGEQNKDKEMPLLSSVSIDIMPFDQVCLIEVTFELYYIELFVFLYSV